MKWLIYMSFPCLLLLAGRELIGQGFHEAQQENANQYYLLSDLKSSKDGKWLTIYKAHDLNNDTIMIFSSRQPEHPVAYRTKMRNITFLSNDNLLMFDSQQAELLNLKEQTSKYYNDVKYIQPLENNTQFILHYNEGEKNRLELLTCSGELLNTLDNVSRFYLSDNHYIFAVSGEENSKTEVFLIETRKKESVYKTTNSISYLGADPGGQGMIICQQDKDTKTVSVLYLDLLTKTIYPLRDVLSVPVQNCSGEVILKGSAYFLRLRECQQEPVNTPADIWYGNDNHLEEKFYPTSTDLRYVWEPKASMVKRIGNDSLTTNISTGSNRHFLSFDPYYFQNYTSGNTPLKLYVYDRIRDSYSVLDTIYPEFYLSGDGKYGLSPADGQWNLYHIPSGEKTQIRVIGLGTPWFTNDCRSVLFEGEGSLWKYEIESGVLNTIQTFEGYQINIVNGNQEVISTRKGRFSKQQINIREPLVIRLFDPVGNITSYTLLKKGKCQTIIPPTTKYIQTLRYNESYDRFFWVEEDYNMPPCLVYKSMDEQEKILYQSNKGDTDVLSLRQEIISYTAGAGILLKGILYYPLSYTPGARYPMVVHIYEKQSQLANRYPFPSYYEGIGFNIRLLIEGGYFVFLPDILIQGIKGPGVDALESVESALDAVSGNGSIDINKIGLIGHSFGAYETDFIATHSKRFAAYVSGAGQSDLVWAYHSFNYNFKWPDYLRIEDNQHKMGVSFSGNKQLYFLNNPLYYVEQVNAPVLLWSGLNDQNVTSDHTMAFYNALRRNKKDVIALYYKNQGHSIQELQSQFDLTSRIMDWFDYFLKENTKIEWISDGIRKKRRAP